MLKILQIYSEASSQLLNFDKSKILFSANASDDLKRQIFVSMGIASARPNGKYLGLPSMWGRSKAKVFVYLIEKVVSKMQGWKDKLLFHASQEVLLKVVV